MLNELRELSLSLEKAGIEVEDIHPSFKGCPKYVTYWVYLNKSGNVSAIAPVPSEQVQKVRKWEKANGISFPAFNMPPIFRAASEPSQQQVKLLKKSIEKGHSLSADEIKSVVDACEDLWAEVVKGKKGGRKQPTIEKLTDCFTKPVADITDFLDAAPDNCKAITQLISRTKILTATTFKEQLASALLNKLHEEPNANLIDVLFFCGEKEPEGKKIPKNFQLILELADWDQFDFPANHQEVQRWMNRQFLGAKGKASRSDLDAFGCNATGRDSKFPPVGFKNALGNVILRAMNQESPCQTRYAMIDFHSFPAGDEVRKGMKGALEWLGSEERKGKTWSDISRRLERPMLLFAYPSEMPEDMPALAAMMGDADEDSAEDNSERFLALAEKVTLALRGGIKETAACEIRVFVLAKMDKARTKVMANGRYSADHVIRSAQGWQNGCRELPTIEVRGFGRSKGDKPVWNKPLIPFPAEVVWCLNTVWMRQGTHAEGAYGFTINDALCLLLGSGAQLQQVTTRGLGTLIRNSTSLLLVIGQSHVQGKVHAVDRKYTLQPLLLPSIIGLLLHKLGYTKGEIMTSPAFLVGRLFNIADSLHFEYCKHVRNNSIPPQLVGNALMATAQEEPTKALSVLWGRIKPYHAWAQTLKEGDHVGLVRYFLKNLGEVSAQLKDADLPKRCTDVDKAQMLLGYLARLESDDK
ncbi:hypothetical protein [Geobacter sp. DSM 9736]|uniref:hypothetical protein n=1 Tax=Geobacter sp. DSM 9736 TaxID=1277350 RepID=UPI000B50DFB2|nr:hypothetical protein [Geobacter sp. DSM 9736]SNB46413.1 hypothetical protein SAMN06269301_1869 [Geobacter sp. DSM 9736]